MTAHEQALAAYDAAQLPDDEPDWGTPASGRLATQARHGEEEYPDDEPNWK